MTKKNPNSDLLEVSTKTQQARMKFKLINEARQHKQQQRKRELKFQIL